MSASVYIPCKMPYGPLPKGAGLRLFKQIAHEKAGSVRVCRMRNHGDRISLIPTLILAGGR